MMERLLLRGREGGLDWDGSLLMPRSVSCPSSRHEAVRAAFRPAVRPTDTPNGLVLTIGIAACRDDVALSGHEEVVNGSCMLHDSCKCALVCMTGIFMHVTFH